MREKGVAPDGKKHEAAAGQEQVQHADVGLNGPLLFQVSEKNRIDELAIYLPLECRSGSILQRVNFLLGSFYSRENFFVRVEDGSAD